MGFCIELEEYRPSELGSKNFRSKRTELRKKLGGTYKRENFLILEKRRFVFVNKTLNYWTDLVDLGTIRSESR